MRILLSSLICLLIALDSVNATDAASKVSSPGETEGLLLIAEEEREFLLVRLRRVNLEIANSVHLNRFGKLNEQKRKEQEQFFALMVQEKKSLKQAIIDISEDIVDLRGKDVIPNAK